MEEYRKFIDMRLYTKEEFNTRCDRLASGVCNWIIGRVNYEGFADESNPDEKKTQKSDPKESNPDESKTLKSKTYVFDEKGAWTSDRTLVQTEPENLRAGYVKVHVEFAEINDTCIPQKIIFKGSVGQREITRVLNIERR